MSALIRNRIRKIEAAVLPPPPAPPKVIKMIASPSAGATAEVVQTFGDELAELRRTCDQVIVVGAAERPDLPGVDYCDTEAEAVVLAAASMPSAAERRSQLDDVLHGLSGRVIGPVDGW